MAKRQTKITETDPKKALLRAAERAGDSLGGMGLVSYFEYQALWNAKDFMNLLAKTHILQNEPTEAEPITKIELIALETQPN